MGKNIEIEDILNVRAPTGANLLYRECELSSLSLGADCQIGFHHLDPPLLHPSSSSTGSSFSAYTSFCNLAVFRLSTLSSSSNEVVLYHLKQGFITYSHDYGC